MKSRKLFYYKPEFRFKKNGKTEHDVLDLLMEKTSERIVLKSGERVMLDGDTAVCFNVETGNSRCCSGPLSISQLVTVRER